MELLDSNQIPLQVAPVGAGTRFGNYILDSIVLYIINLPIKFIPFMAAAQVNMQESIKEASANGDFGGMFGAMKGYLLMSIGISLVTTLLYYVLMEFYVGKTLGKMITKTKVVMEDGSERNMGAIFIRTICRWIPFEPFSFLFGGPVGWHDSISKTRVVSDQPIVGVGY